MDWQTPLLTELLRIATWLLPPGRRQWAEAVQAEAVTVEAGRARQDWLAGGLWLVLREANMLRKIVYWSGIAAIAVITTWAVWLSWRTVPSVDREAMADRFRILVPAAALAGLPWLDRHRGRFGPVGNTITARVLRVAGCAVLCGLGLAVVHGDSHAGLNGFGQGTFSWLEEIGGLIALALVLTGPVILRSRWPRIEASTVWTIIAMAVAGLLLALPVQTLAVLYIVGILAATSRTSPVSSVSLRVGGIAGLALAATIYEVAPPLVTMSVAVAVVIAAATAVLAGGAAGVATAWLLADVGGEQTRRAMLVRQGLFAGIVTGATCGLVGTLATGWMMVMMVLGPLASLGGGMVGAALVADRLKTVRARRSWAGGLFVLMRSGRSAETADN